MINSFPSISDHVSRFHSWVNVRFADPFYPESYLTPFYDPDVRLLSIVSAPIQEQTFFFTVTGNRLGYGEQAIVKS